MIGEETLDAVALATSKAAVFGGSTAAVVFGLTAYDVAAITGAVVAVAGLLVQIYYNRKRDRRETREHLVRMSKYLSKPTK